MNKDTQYKEKTIGVRLTEQQHQELEEKAKQEGFRKSEYVRFLILKALGK